LKKEKKRGKRKMLFAPFPNTSLIMAECKGEGEEKVAKPA